MMWPFKKQEVPATASNDRDAWSRFVEGKAIECWMDAERQRRVFLVKRNDGLFIIQREHYQTKKDCEYCDPGWMPDGGDYGSYFDSEETAIQEIHGKCPWSTDV